MIYFVTNNLAYYYNAIDTNVFKDIKVVSPEEGKEIFYKKLANKRILSVDLEATDLDAYIAKPLLYGIGTPKLQLMYDWTVDCEYAFV